MMGKGLLVRRIGAHVSIAGSLDKAVDRAVERGCTTFQIFTRTPRAWKYKDIPEEAATRFVEKCQQADQYPIVAHMPYLPNFASPNSETYQKSVDTLRAELKRCEQLHIPYLVTHLGSHVGAGMEIGLTQILEAIDYALTHVENNVMLLFENTAGTKNSMGSSFEHIQRILEGLTQHENRIGVCFDTAHGFAAGYDLRTKMTVNKTLKTFDNVIGLKKLKVIHANDTKGALNSRIDRHEHIGLGKIGETGFKTLLTHSYVRELPFILETPIDERRRDVENIRKLQELADAP